MGGYYERLIRLMPSIATETITVLRMPFHCTQQSPACLSDLLPLCEVAQPTETQFLTAGLLASIVPQGSHALTAKPAEGLTAATLLQQMSAAAQKGGVAAAAAGTAVGLQQAAQAGVPAQRLAGAADRRFAMTPEPGAPVAAHQMVQPVPQGQAAEGWKVSLVFRGESRAGR